MSSRSSDGDLHEDVDVLVRALLRKYPTLMFTKSSLAEELPYDESQVHEALLLQCQRGLLQIFISWNCPECDSPSASPISDRDPVGWCRTCRKDVDFERFVYFRATDVLMRRIEADPKLEAVPDDALERIEKRASEPPKNSDRFTERDSETLQRIAVAAETMVVHTARDADASEATAEATSAALPHSARTAAASEATAHATTTTARDWAPRIAVYVSIAAIVVVIGLVIVQETHIIPRLLRAEATASPSPHASAIASAAPTRK